MSSRKNKVYKGNPIKHYADWKKQTYGETFNPDGDPTDKFVADFLKDMVDQGLVYEDEEQENQEDRKD